MDNVDNDTERNELIQDNNHLISEDNSSSDSSLDGHHSDDKSDSHLDDSLQRAVPNTQTWLPCIVAALGHTESNKGLDKSA